jgi:flagellar FliJ protein
MSPFRLAGLLRVRTLREDRARSELAAAQARAATATLEASLRASVVARAAAPAGGRAPVFLATVAARAAEVSSLTEAIAAEQLAAADAETARRGWVAARNDTRVVQRLAERHRDEQRREQDRLDQHEADDRSGTAVARRREDGATS